MGCLNRLGGVFSRTKIPSSDRRVESLGWSGISNGQALSSRRGWFLWTLGSFRCLVLKLKSRIWKRLASWWFQGFFLFSPLPGKMMIQFDYMIFFNGVVETTNSSWICFFLVSFVEGWKFMDSMGWTKKNQSSTLFGRRFLGNFFCMHWVHANPRMVAKLWFYRSRRWQLKHLLFSPLGKIPNFD